MATTASLAAEAKLAELRALPWGDATTDLSVDPPASGGPGLGPSPVNALAANLPGYSDYVDADGQPRVGHVPAAEDILHRRQPRDRHAAGDLRGPEGESPRTGIGEQGRDDDDGVSSTAASMHIDGIHVIGGSHVVTTGHEARHQALTQESASRGDEKTQSRRGTRCAMGDRCWADEIFSETGPW